MTIATDVCAACGRASGSAPLCTSCLQPLIGASLGPDKRYRVDALISREVGACAWLGTDLAGQRRCVLQTYRSAALPERQVLAGGGSRVLLLRHPRLPQPLEVFEEQAGALFVLVLGAPEAPSLRDLVAAHGPMPIDAACTLGLQIGEALEFLTGHDLIHEGLTPETIAVGTPLSAALKTVTVPRMARAQVDGAARGPYQAPELIAGWPYGHPISIYGFASVLIFGLTGQDPVDAPGGLVEDLLRVGAPPALADALSRARTIDPAGRPDLPALLAVLGAGAERSQPAHDATEMTTVHGGLRTLDRASHETEAVTLQPPSRPPAVQEERPAPPADPPADPSGEAPTDELTVEHPTAQAAAHPPNLLRERRPEPPAPRWPDAPSTPQPIQPPPGPDDLLQTADQVEQRGDLYGALDLYRRALDLAPPDSDQARRLLARASAVEGRLVAARSPGPGRALATERAPLPPVRRQRGGGLRWLVGVVVCLIVAGLVALGGSRGWMPGQGASSPEATPIPTPAAVLVAPPAGAPPTSTSPVRPDPTGLLGAADEARTAGDFQRAMDILQGLKAMTPPPDGIDDRLYQTHVAYGQKLLERGEHPASLDQFAAALAIRPDGREALDGQRLVRQIQNWDQIGAQWDNDPDAALAAAEANYAIDPTWRDTREKLYALLIGRADRQWARGEPDAARATLERAMTVDPGAGDADDRMRRWFAAPSPSALTAPPPDGSSPPPTEAPGP
jgi:serine/threonine-protein kinase